MKRVAIVIIMLMICVLPFTMVEADVDTPGDDLIETVFQGIVTDMETGDPIENAQMYGFDDGYNEWRYDTTDDEGRYYLEFMRGGTFYLYAEHEDYYQEEIIVESDINVKNDLDFELEPKVFNTTIYGTVTDSETGEPISDVVVVLYEVEYEGNGYSGYGIGYMVTSEEGTYSFEAYRGDFEVRANMEEYYTYWSEPFFVDEGERYQLDIEMYPWNTGVNGVVKDEQGNPMSDIVVTLENDWLRTNDVTDENGEYEIIIPRGGEFTLKAHEDGYRPYVETITIQDGEMEEVNIEMVESQLPSPVLKIIYIILSLLAGL